ncbi:MAG: PspC domain-containing protein [Eubacteriaceae bacterium]|nr:PspC domain-containing protein [Eubacteriaceae bacterium]
MNRSLHKSRRDKMFLGVCGGVAEYFQIDPSIVRILWAIAGLVYGTGVLLYFIAAFILPYDEEDDTAAYEEKNPEQAEIDSDKQKKILGAIILLAGVFLLMRNFRLFFDMDIFWSGLLVVMGLLLIFKGKGKQQ